jgi:hypothetical protein
MASFASVLKPADTEAIRWYIVSRATEVKNNPPPGFGQPPGQQRVQQPHEEKGR